MDDSWMTTQDDGSGEEALPLLVRADALRDAGDWIGAAAAYSGYLRLNGTDWPIWVQYGHCVKEAGDPAGALPLYREAERLRPEDADVHLQIGHALKLLGRGEEARVEYARALELDPGLEAARAEMPAPEPVPAPEPEPQPEPEAAPTPEAPPAPAAAAELVFDVSDLLDYYRHNRTPTGIQRVQLNIVEHALTKGATPAAACTFDPAAGAWKALPAEAFLALARLSRIGGDIADPEWLRACADANAAMTAAPAFPFAPGMSLVNIGTSWWLPDFLLRVREVQGRHGVRYIPFLHDCIPLLVPEHCAVGLVDEFARWFTQLCLHADTVLVNSDCTAQDFRRLQRQLLPELEIPTYVVPLDAASELQELAVPPLALAPRPYVLMVSTIESRKNHLLVFNAWLRLIRSHGAESVPELVCVGKPGWLAEAALNLRTNSAALQAKVTLLHGVPDTALAGLYRGCLFTLFNSFYEGWGLPVTESLAFGKVPLVADNSSLRQAGGPGAVYFTPQSEPDLVAKLEHLIWDADFRRAHEDRLRQESRLRRWSEVADQLAREVADSRRHALPPARTRLRLRPGEVVETRLLPGPDPRREMATADLLRDGSNWFPLEDWGVWTRPGVALLRIPLGDLPGQGPLRLMLELLGPPEACRLTLRAGTAGGARATIGPLTLGAGETLYGSFDLAAESGAELLVELDAPERSRLALCQPQDSRAVGVGLRSVMTCRREDHGARLDYLERRSLHRLVRA